jgi:hypothetical protein
MQLGERVKPRHAEGHHGVAYPVQIERERPDPGHRRKAPAADEQRSARADGELAGELDIEPREQ